jgi:hypothetical protein
MPPIDKWSTFILAPGFAQDWGALGLTDAGLSRLQWELVEDPEAGAVVKGTGGLRKYRFAPPGAGKSGGCRVCYAHFPRHGTVYLVVAYGKSQKADLSAAEKKAIARELRTFEAGLDAAR